MKKIIFLMIVSCSIFSFGQKKYFNEAIENGRKDSEFYYISIKEGKAINNKDIYDYAAENSIIIKNMTYQEVNRFGDKFTGVSSFQFLPTSEIPEYIFSKYASKNLSNTKLAEVKNFNTGNVYIFNPKTLGFQKQTAFWSGNVTDNYIQGNGFGCIISDSNNEIICFNGNYSNGVLQENASFQLYNYTTPDIDNGKLYTENISLSNFHDGLASIKYKDKYGFIDSNFNVVIQPKFEQINTPFNNGQAYVSLNNEKIIIDSKGNFIDYTQEQKNIFEAIRIQKEREQKRLAYYKPQIEAFNNLAYKYANYYKSEINENTGRNPNYQFLREDYDQEIREVDLTWVGASCGVCPRQNYVIRGRLNVTTGEFIWDSNNSAVDVTSTLNQIGSSIKTFVADAFKSLPPPSNNSNSSNSDLGIIFQQTKCNVYFNEIDYGVGVRDNSDSVTETYYSSFTTKDGQTKEFTDGHDDNYVGFNFNEFPINVYVKFISDNDKVVEVKAIINKPAELDIKVNIF